MAGDTEARKKTGGNITIADAASQEPWVKVPADMLRDERISGNAIRLYGALYLCAWEANYTGGRGYEGQQALADEFAMSQSALSRALIELHQAGYIEIERVGLGEPDNITLLR